MVRHSSPSPHAGETVTVSFTMANGVRIKTEAVVEDWWDRVATDRDWRTDQSPTACLYRLRLALAMSRSCGGLAAAENASFDLLELSRVTEGEILYVKIDPVGDLRGFPAAHLVHITEIQEAN